MGHAGNNNTNSGLFNNSNVSTPLGEHVITDQGTSAQRHTTQHTVPQGQAVPDVTVEHSVGLGSGGAAKGTVVFDDITRPVGVDAFAAQNIDDPLNYGDGESSISSVSKRKRKLKSGMVAEPSDNIKSVEIWPHYSLQYSYAVAPVTFENITFEQYVVGEIRTCFSVKDGLEIRGRMRLMARLATLKTKGYPWHKLRALYAGTVRGIEMRKTSWLQDWKEIEDDILDPGDRIRPEKGDRAAADKKGKKDERWFCRNYNKSEGCQLTPPHDASVGKPPRRRKVEHFCAACWIKEKEVRLHPETDSSCPQKQ